MVEGIIEIHSKTRADPVGSCIYCGCADELSDEHVVPFALGGRLILPKASCRTCADTTKVFEQSVLRGFMLDARTAGGFPTRRRKERPSTISLQVRREDRFERIELPSDACPGVLHLPTFSRAALLTGRPPVKGVENIGVESIVFGRMPEEVLHALGADTLRFNSKIDITAFVRMLAKIGYSYAVGVIGPYPLAEVPVLPLIVGKADDGSTWVGSDKYKLSVEDRKPAHALGLLSMSLTVDSAVESVLVARVKLFADTGATGYEVVVRRTQERLVILSCTLLGTENITIVIAMSRAPATGGRLLESEADCRV